VFSSSFLRKMVLVINTAEVMLVIRLEKISVYNHKYWVYLDSENNYSFVNRRVASDFLIAVSKRFTDTLVFINDEYCQAEVIYRQYYFMIEDFKLRQTIENSLEFIKSKLALILFRCGGENRNSLVINGIENMLFELKSVYKHLEDVAISRSDTGIRHKIATKTRIMDLFIIDFKNFEDEITVSRSEIQINHDIKLRRVV